MSNPTMPPADDDGYTWNVRAALGEIDSERALNFVRSLNVLGPDELRSLGRHELADALEAGNRAHPRKRGRYPSSDELPPVIDVDPDTMAALDELMAEPTPIAGRRKSSRRQAGKGGKVVEVEFPGAVPPPLRQTYVRQEAGEHPGLFHRRMTPDGPDLRRLVDAAVELVRSYVPDTSTPHPLHDAAGTLRCLDAKPEVHDLRVWAGADAGPVEVRGVSGDALAGLDFLDRPEVLAATGGRHVSRDPGRDSKGRIVEAVYATSTGVEVVPCFDRIGWHLRGGRLFYVHAGGAIDARGATDDVHVVADDLTEWYRLPAAPADVEAGARVWEATRVVFDVVTDPDLSGRVPAPLFCAPWRAAMGRARGSITFDAVNRSGKSGLMALVAQHFAPATRHDRWPTPGAEREQASSAQLERMLHAVGDAVLPLDDLSSDESPEQQRRRYSSLARTLFNGSFRGRMNRDRTQGDVRRPRCFGMLTAENVSAAESAENRTHFVSLTRGGVDVEALRQADAGTGPADRSAAMAAFLAWMAAQATTDDPGLDRWRAERFTAAREWLRAAVPDVEARYIAPAAELLAGGLAWIDCADALGWTDHDDAESTRHLVLGGMVESLRHQVDRATGRSLPDKLVTWLLAGLRAGQCHATSIEGKGNAEPAESWRWGWDRNGQPRGDHVGWVSPTEPHVLYASPEACYQFLVTFGRGQVDEVPTSMHGVAAALAGAGIISTTPDRNGGRRTVRRGIRKRCGDAIPRVWDIRLPVDDDGTSGPTAPAPPLDELPAPAPPPRTPASGPTTPAEQPELLTGTSHPAEATAGRQRRTERPMSPGPAVAAGGVLVVEGGRLGIPAPGGGRDWRQLDDQAQLPELLAEVDQAAAGRSVTVLVAESDHKRWKLPPQPPRNAAGKVPAWLRPAREAGWHRPGTEAQPPIVTRHVRMSLAGAESVVTLMPVRWLAPTDYPRWTPDPAVPDTADVCELADRLDDFARVVGWAHEGSTAATGLRMLRHLVERTAKRAPKWQADRRRSWPTPHQVDTWSRELTATEAAEASHVHTWDAVRNYLPAIRAASIASDELRHHDAPPFDPAQAGYWLVTVPAMPDPRVPSPVRADPGGEVWVTTDVMRLWDDLGVHPEVHEAWTAPAVDHEGRRQFVDVVRRILDDDQAPEHVRAAVKHLYQTVHGKLRDPHQATIARPDWGHAIRDAAWCGTLRKACQAAGLLPLPARVTGGGRQRTSSARWPIEVHTDAIAYASPVEHAEAPEGIEVGPQLGRFRHESTVTIAEWQEGRS